MSDLMKWMYDHYIRSYIESQPKDDGESMWFDLLEHELGPLQQESLEAVTAFFAVHGFRQMCIRDSSQVICDFS